MSSVPLLVRGIAGMVAPPNASASPNPSGRTIQVGGRVSRRQLAPVGNLAALLQPCRGADSLVLPRCKQLSCARGREEAASLRSQARHAPALSTQSRRASQPQ